MSGREPAWRVLALELNAAVEEEKGAGEKAASYLLSPLGARMSRVLVTGTLTPPETVGKPDGPPFLRARLADPTGTIAVTAGSFQPRALAQLRAHQEASLALVVGKVNLFRGRDGNAYVSVRAEGVRRVAENVYREQLAETLRLTLDRLGLMRTLKEEPSVDDDRLRRAGHPAAWIRAARAATARYPPTELARLRSPLTSVLQQLRPSLSSPPPRPGAVRITRTPPPPPPKSRSAAEQAEASAFLDVIDGLAEGSVDGYADLREAVRVAAVRGVTAERAEELLNFLEEDGVLEEPIVGKLRRA